MTVSMEGQWLVPMALKHWAREALTANQQLLTCLQKYLNPTDVANDIVPSIQHALTELSAINTAIEEILPGWRTKAKSNN